MFEINFEDMFADVWVSDRDRSYADEEGIGFYDVGFNTFHSMDAIITVRKYDRALCSNIRSTKRNCLRAHRNAIVAAFGPEMVERMGFAK